MRAFIHPFIHSFIHSFIHPSIHPPAHVIVPGKKNTYIRRSLCCFPSPSSITCSNPPHMESTSPATPSYYITLHVPKRIRPPRQSTHCAFRPVSRARQSVSQSVGRLALLFALYMSFIRPIKRVSCLEHGSSKPERTPAPQKEKNSNSSTSGSPAAAAAAAATAAAVRPGPLTHPPPFIYSPPPPPSVIHYTLPPSCSAKDAFVWWGVGATALALALALSMTMSKQLHYTSKQHVYVAAGRIQQQQ